MQKAERCYTDCPLVGIPFATIRTAQKYPSNVPLAIEIMVSNFAPARCHFYANNRWADSNDSNLHRVREMNLHARIDRFTGQYNPNGQGNRASDPLAREFAVPVRFRLASGKRIKSTFWTPGPKQVKELKRVNPLGITIHSDGEEGDPFDPHEDVDMTEAPAQRPAPAPQPAEPPAEVQEPALQQQDR